MRNPIIIWFCFLSMSVSAQFENKDIKTGNENYQNKNYAEAEAGYKSALEINPKSEPATFNLGNALFGQEKFDDAMQYFQKVGETTSDPTTRAQAYHNLGNANLIKQDYEKSIEAYKNALKANPNDMDTKYNLAYAQKKLQQQQQQQQKQDQQEQKQDQQQKDQQQQEQKNKQQQNDQQQQQAKPQPKKYSKEDLERIMQALNNEDKKTQDKVNKQKMETQKVTIDKDW